ncbi:MAG: tetratricopeptide repeat protein [Caldilineaceae bacterium]|nr:tetratricopeptide repeat protein [Caldilineaceae bacterium]
MYTSPQAHQQAGKFEENSDPQLQTVVEQSIKTQEHIQQWLAAPIYERLDQNSANFLAEIRPITVLFLHFGGISLIGEDRAEPEKVQQELDRYVRWVQRLLARHEGYLLKLTFDDKGSYGVITFGAPKSSYGDTARALAAALELRTPPQNCPFITEVKLGIHRGRVLAGAFGSTARAAYDLLGSAVNHGSRYMMAAAPGEILLSEAVATDGSPAFQLDYLGPYAFKGLTEARAVYALRGHRPTLFTVPERLVGRAHELALLDGWLHQSRSGQGQIVIVEGPAGIGKSHLIGAFAHQAVVTGAIAAIGVCDYIGRQIPYYPWRRIIGQLITTVNHETRTPQQQVLLGEFLEQTQPNRSAESPALLREPQRRQEALFALISEIIVACAAVQPLVLVIEDLYFCDQASMELLRVVSRLVPEHALLLLLVQHPNPSEEKAPLLELQQQPYFHILTVGELSTTNIAAIIAARLKGTADPLLLDLIHHQSQGNPLYAEEFALALRDLDRLDYAVETARYTVNQQLLATLRRANCLVRKGETGVWRLRSDATLSPTDLGLPDILHELVNIRVDQLPESLTITLYTAALLGQRFSQKLLTAAHINKLSVTFIKKQLTYLVDQALLIHTPGDDTENHYAFRHNLVQKVIYEKVPEQQKEILHRHIGEALEAMQPEAVEQLAFHFVRTDQAEKAVRYLEAAAHKSRDEFANEAALNFYEQALRYEERLEWLVAKVELLHILGMRDQECALLDTLAAQADQLPFIYPYLSGKYYEAISQFDVAQHFANQAIQVAQAENDRLQVVLCHLLQGLIARRQGNYHEAIQRYQAGVALVDIQRVESAEEAASIVDLYIGLSNVLRQQGAYEQATAYCQQARTICEEWGNVYGQGVIANTLGIIANYLRNFATARQHHQQALQNRRTIGHLVGEGESLCNLALTDYEEGHFEQAHERLQQASAIQQALENYWEMINIANLRGVLHYEVGDFVAAHRELQQGIQACEQVGDQAGWGYLLCNLGQVARDSGQFEVAARSLLESIDIAKQQADRSLQAMGQSHLALVRLYEGKLQEAIALAEQALQIREELGVYELTTIDLTTLANAYRQANQPERACSFIERALQLLTDCAGVGPEFPHWDYYHCYVVLWWLGEEAQAITALQTAYTMLMKRANAISDVKIRTMFLTQVPRNGQILAAAKRHGLV